MIDNDFHPLDKGLEATNDHWGTQLADNTRPANDNNKPDYSLAHRIWQNAPKLSPRLGESK